MGHSHFFSVVATASTGVLFNFSWFGVEQQGQVSFSGSTFTIHEGQDHLFPLRPGKDAAGLTRLIAGTVAFSFSIRIISSMSFDFVSLSFSVSWSLSADTEVSESKFLLVSDLLELSVGEGDTDFLTFGPRTSGGSNVKNNSSSSISSKLVKPNRFVDFSVVFLGTNVVSTLASSSCCFDTDPERDWFLESEIDPFKLDSII